MNRGNLTPAAAAVVVVSGCGAPSSNNGSSTTSKATETTASPAVAKPSDGDIADAARRQTLQSFSLPPDGNFITDYQCVGEPSDLSYCWPRYLTNFTFASGVLHVNVQVDRESPEGQAQGEAAAKAIANIMGAAYDEPILRESVNWVEADDGAGTAISQSQVRAS